MTTDLNFDGSTNGLSYRLRGSAFQALTLKLSPSTCVYAEAGALLWRTDDILMQTRALQGNSLASGLTGLLKRSLAGEDAQIVQYERSGASGRGLLSLAPSIPGQIVPIHLTDDEAILAQRGAFLASDIGVTIAPHLQKKLGTALFGGTGFVLQKLSGPGVAFLEFAGQALSFMLRPGEVVKVDPDHIAAFSNAVDFSIETVKGVRNKLWGGEGLFLASLTGPGRVWLQTMTTARLAASIAPHLDFDIDIDEAISH